MKKSDGSFPRPFFFPLDIWLAAVIMPPMEDAAGTSGSLIKAFAVDKGLAGSIITAVDQDNMRYCPRFPQSVRNAASALRREVTVRMMQEWWNGNRAHILAGNYASVLPPRNEKEANQVPDTARKLADPQH